MSMKTKNWGKVYLIMLLVWIPFFGSAKKNNVTIYPMPRGEKTVQNMLFLLPGEMSRFISLKSHLWINGKDGMQWISVNAERDIMILRLLLILI